MCYLLLFATCSYAQINKLYQIKQSLEKKISVGSSTDEVKNILGKPAAVEGGFPQSDELIITSLPDQVGQVNNSTWFYFLPIRKITYDYQADAMCYLNGIEVQQDVYDEYKNLDSIWLHDGKPTSMTMVEGYKIMRDENLKLVLKKISESFIKTIKANKVTSSFVPILCVIFDKGTQVVASTQVYFKLIF